MRSFLIPLTAALVCSFLLVPCKAEGKADQVILVTDENKQPLAGVKLEAYQDMEGKKPLMDENDQPLIITSNEEGRADPDAAPYLRIQSMPGFYHDPSVYPADHENLTLHHIHVEGKVRKNKEEDEDTKNTEDHTKEEEKNEYIDLVFYQEDGKEITADQLEAGKTYQAAEKEPESFRYCPPQIFTIPLCYEAEQDPLVLEFDAIPYGRVTFAFNEPNIQTELKDETGKPVKDIYDHETLQKENDENEISYDLKAGTYQLCFKDLPEQYMWKDPLRIEAEKGKEKKQDIVLEKMQAQVILLDGSDKSSASASVSITHADGKQEKGEKFFCSRNEKIRIHVEDAGEGLFNPPDQEYTIPSMQKYTEVIPITLQPFTFQCIAQDSESGEMIPASFAYFDDDGNPLETIHASDTVHIRETQVPAGYEESKEQIIHLPLVSSESQTYKLVFANRPFVKLTIHSPAGSGIAVYTDQACTQPASDQEGEAMQAITDESGSVSFAVWNGTYYVRQTSCPPDYWLNEKTIRVECSRKKGEEASVSFSNEAVRGTITQEGAEAKYEILENGKVIDTVEAGTDVPLQRGFTYVLKPVDVSCKAKYEEEKNITIPQAKEDLSYAFHYEPYFDLQLACGQKVNGLILTEEKKAAADINGNPTVFNLDHNSASFHLKPGRYFLKIFSDTHSYVKDMEEIDLQQDEDHEIKVRNTSALVHLVNDDNQNVAGRNMELRDEEGRVIETWKSTDTPQIIESFRLVKGKQSSVREIGSAKEEMTFSLPAEEPEKETEVEVKTQTETPAKEGRELWLAGAAGLFVMVAFPLVILERKKHDGFS